MKIETSRIITYSEEMKRNEEGLIKLIWDTVDKFIAQWQKSPYEWNTEIDIQVELASRLKESLRKSNQHLQKAKYKDVRNKGFETQIYSRVCCEPLIYYECGTSKRYPSYPDIVIFQNIKNSIHPPDDNDQKRNWPMLWVCEIKYQNEFSGGSSRKNKEWDTEKIGYLLKQKDGARFACCLDFNRIREKSMTTGRRFRKYKIRLPKE